MTDKQRNTSPLFRMIITTTLMKKIYATYRMKPLNQWAGLYTPSYFFDVMFADYKQAWLTYIEDLVIDESRYTGELVPWVPKKNRLLIWFYNENYVSETDFKHSLTTTWSEFHISLLDTVEEARQWVRDNTDLVEVSEWIFEISQEHNNYLTID